MEQETNNQAPSTWVCECSQVNNQAQTTCQICGLPNPTTQDRLQQQGQPMELEQPQPQPQAQPQTQAQSQEQAQAQAQEQPASQSPAQADAQAQVQNISRFKNVYDYGPVQIIGTVPGRGDLVPKTAIRNVIKNFNRNSRLIVVSHLGIVGQGKSMYANVLNYLLLNGRKFTPFEVGEVVSITKGLNIFSNPLFLKNDPETQVINMDVEGAYGLKDEPPEAQALGLKRLYALTMLLSSVVIIHLGAKPGQSEITLLNQASGIVIDIQSKLLLDLPKIYLLIKDAQDDANSQEEIQKIRKILEGQLDPKIMNNIEILPRGKLSPEFYNSNPLDFSKVDQGYLNQLNYILASLSNYKKNNPLLPSQPLKIEAFPEILEKLGVGILNNPEYLPYLEQSIDFLRAQELYNCCQKHLGLYTEESKILAEDPKNLALTIEQFTAQLNSIQAKHQTNFLQEAEAINKKKVEESPFLQSLKSQFDAGMRIGSFELVFVQEKLKQEQQQVEKEKQEKRQQELIQQEEAAKQQKAQYEQQRQAIAQQHQQDMNKHNETHRQLIQQYKAQRAQQIAQAQEKNKQQQQQMQAEVDQANANQQQKASQYENQQAQLNQKIEEEQKKAEEQKAQQQMEIEKTKQEQEQQKEEKEAQVNQETAEAERQAEEQQKKQEEEAKQQQEQQAQEKAAMQQQVQDAAQDDDDDDSGGDCCNIF